MNTLFLDLASHAGCLAALDDEHVVSDISVDHRVSDHEVLPLLDQLFVKAGWTIGDMQRIACVTGPGGFTSLRVAVTLANTLADQLGVPMAGVHVSDICRSRLRNSELGIGKPSMAPAPSKSPNSDFRIPVFWLHSTKATALFFRDLSDATSEPSLITLDEIKERLPEHCQWTGELIPVHRAVVDAKGCTQAELRPLSEVLPALLATLEYRRSPLEPWYGRGW